jgi:hypothetical protein
MLVSSSASADRRNLIQNDEGEYKLVTVQGSKQLWSKYRSSMWRGSLLATTNGRDSFYLQGTRYVFLGNRGSVNV